GKKTAVQSNATSTRIAPAERAQESTDATRPPAVPAAVAASLANAQAQLAALNDSPAIESAPTPVAAPATAQDAAVAVTVAPPAVPVPRSVVPRPVMTPMPRGFWPAVDMYCDYPEAVRDAYRSGESGPGSVPTYLRVTVLAGVAYGAAMGATNALQGVAGYAPMVLVTALKLP